MEQKNKDYSTVALILGCCSIIAWLIPLFGYPITIVGIILGAKSLSGESNGKAVTGLVLSIIFLILTLINSIAGAAFMTSLMA